MTETNYQINSEVLGQIADLLEELNGVLSYHELAPAIKFVDIVLAERSDDSLGLNLSLYNRTEASDEVELVLVDIDTIELLDDEDAEEEKPERFIVDGKIDMSKLPSVLSVNQTIHPSIISEEEIAKAAVSSYEGRPNPYEGLKGHGL
jgi:hypothetical protein